MPSIRLKNWNTMPTWRRRSRARASSPRPVRSVPATTTPSRVGALQPGEHVEERRLPAARRAGEGDELAGARRRGRRRAARARATVAASKVRRTSRATSTSPGPRRSGGLVAVHPRIGLVGGPQRCMPDATPPRPPRQLAAQVTVDRVLHAAHEVRRTVLAAALGDEADQEVGARLEIDGDVVGRAWSTEGDAGERPASTTAPPRAAASSSLERLGHAVGRGGTGPSRAPRRPVFSRAKLTRPASSVSGASSKAYSTASMSTVCRSQPRARPCRRWAGRRRGLGSRWPRCRRSWPCPGKSHRWRPCSRGQPPLSCSASGVVSGTISSATKAGIASGSWGMAPMAAPSPASGVARLLRQGSVSGLPA